MVVAINQSTTDRKVVHMPKTLAQKISRYRFGNEIKAESEAIRRLIEKGLEAVEAEGRTEGGAQA
jgi:metal-responsive CopG/Arc/MetJ family transcriptional regulator